MSFRMPWEQATSSTSSSSCTTTVDNELKPTPVFSRSAANHGWSGFMRRRVLLTSLSFRDLLRTQNLRTHNRTLLPRNEYHNARPEDFSARRRNMVRLVVLACCRRHCFHNPGNSDGRDRTYTYCYVIPADPIRFEERLLRAFSRGAAAEC